MSRSREDANRRLKIAFRLTGAAFCLLLSAAGVLAQSTDIDFPTPVRASELNGVILPRDVGDPRPTRHFYAVTGTPGDLTITVESTNLDGAVDLFTAGTLRPLTQVSLYAGTSATSAAKSIYLKRREALVLRVEARSPNESEGSYRIRFEGAFEPIMGEVATAPEITQPGGETRAAGKTRRVTSVGARIEEPPVETSRAEPTPTPTPQPSEPDAKEPAERPAEEAADKPAPKPRSSARNSRTGRTTRTRPPRRTARTTPEKPTPEKTVPAPVEPVQAEAEPRPAAPAASSTSPSPAAIPRLIIETRDGTRVERFMNTVRRVTVEGGQVVVVMRDGKVERQPLTNILRMSIEP